MPYITQIARDEIDPRLFPILNHIEGLAEGELNYVITRIIDRWARVDGYVAFNAVRGVLSEVGDEFRRRRVVPYEERKRLLNGDVYGIVPTSPQPSEA